MSAKNTTKKKTAAKKAAKGKKKAVAPELTYDEALQIKSEEAQRVLDKAVNDQLLGRADIVLGVKLRPITLATITLLKEVDSQLIEGKDIELIDNILYECCIFMLIQSIPIEEATELVYGDKSQLVMATMKLADTIAPNEISSLSAKIISMLVDATSTQVTPIPNSTSNSLLEDDDDDLNELISGNL